MSDEPKGGGQEAEFWNKAGGDMWVANMVRTHELLQPLWQALLARAAPGAGESVLDVGCGGGATSVDLATGVGATGTVVGVDVSAMILERAKAQPSLPNNLSFELADAATAELGEAQFDLICSRFGIMFFEEPKAAFANLCSALKPNGRLVVMCWQKPEDNPWISRPVKATAEILPGPAERPDPRAPGPFAFADPAWVEEILETAGFANVQLEAVEQRMPMGSMDAAVTHMMGMGPSAEAIANAREADRAAIDAAIRDAFASYDTPDGVMAPCATWIVTAQRA